MYSLGLHPTHAQPQDHNNVQTKHTSLNYQVSISWLIDHLFTLKQIQETS